MGYPRLIDRPTNGAPEAPFEAVPGSRPTPRLGFFLPFRLATFVVLMLIVIGWMADPQYLRFQTIVYAVLTLAFALSLALEKRYNLYRLTRFLIGLQFLLEISLESGIIFVSGNVNSPFSALFVLTIVSAALSYRMVGTLVVASLVSVAYAFIIWLGLAGATPAGFDGLALRTIFSTHEPALYGFFLHFLIFYLTAFVSGYLAERLSAQDRRLADASHALRRARLETDDILRHLNSGLLTVDSSGKVVFFNRAAERILGYLEENVKGLSCQEVFAERMPQLSGYLMAGVEAHTAYPRKELDVVTSDQEVIPLGLSTSVLTEDSGQVRGVIAIFSDLTEAKQLEQKVRDSDRLAAVGELAASIAHEIRNPLTAISGSVEVLQRDLHLTGENGHLMALILKESQRLNTILTDFLAYARMGRPSHDKVELCHVISDVCELLRRHHKVSDQTSIDLRSDDSIVYVFGDEGLIRQLLLNLAINAAEALAGAGSISFEVTVNRGEGTVDLVVADTGPGISSDLQAKIFQPFFSTKKGGTGLGLAIVHRICTVLKLKLKVDSNPAEGTTFSIQFRSYAAAAKAAESPEPRLTSPV